MIHGEKKTKIFLQHFGILDVSREDTSMLSIFHMLKLHRMHAKVVLNSYCNTASLKHFMQQVSVKHKRWLFCAACISSWHRRITSPPSLCLSTCLTVTIFWDALCKQVTHICLGTLLLCHLLVVCYRVLREPNATARYSYVITWSLQLSLKVFCAFNHIFVRKTRNTFPQYSVLLV